MIYRFILKLFICSVGIVIFNLITYGLLSIEYAPNGLSWLNIISVFFRDLLFKNNLYLFKYSIVLSVLGFVSYLLFEYYNDKKELSEKETLIVSIKNELYAIANGNWVWGFILILIGFGLMIGNLVFLLFFQIPFSRGWKVLMLNDYFEYPTSYFWTFREYDRIAESIIFCTISSVIFFLFLFASFAKRSRFEKSEIKSDSWIDDSLIKYHNKIRLIYFLYLIYLIPTIFAWLYPIILFWLDKLPSNSLAVAPIPLSFKVLSYLFASGFLFTIYSIFKNNRRVNMTDMKEEIKIELMNENKTDHNSV
jgi:hypothetical protein